MDEMKECPWCGSLRVESETAEGTPYFYSAVFCRDCDRGVRADDAIADWNALPRAPKWVEYDGTESTLPPHLTFILIETGQNSFAIRHNAEGSCSDVDGYEYAMKPKDRWMPWPEDK